MVNSYPEKSERSLIYNKYRGLMRVCKVSFTEEECKLIREAFKIGLNYYLSKKAAERFSIFYPLAVARIIAEEIGLGVHSVISALLYDLVLNSDMEIKDIEKKFGKHVAQIITGLSKISALDTEKTSAHAENFRKLLLNLADDVRVIIIKLADRLHYMRIMDPLSKEKQLKVSAETFYLYAPLAHRLGLYKIKSEMEDIALRYTNPKIYNSIEQKLKETKEIRNKFIREFIKPVKNVLSNQKYQFDILGRPKSIFSIWGKMNRQQVEFEEVYDIFAIRIILNNVKESEKADCWNVYSVVTNFYKPNPQRLRDWISIPKTNGYESLHTTVMGPGGKWVEVQIRSKRMNEIAEKGLAAHWKYKGKEKRTVFDEWLTRVREILEANDQDSEDFIENVKLNLYSDEVFVFTPTGEVRRLPVNATVLDFAFEIHSDVGATCVGAKVNSRNVTIRHILENGDQVEIITSKNQRPKPDWLNFVNSSKAKSKIKQSLKEERYKEAEKGKETLRRKFKNWKIKFNDENINKLLKEYKLNNSPELYFLVATDKIDISKIKELLTDVGVPDHIETEKHLEEYFSEKAEKSTTVKKDDYLVIDDNVDHIGYKLSKCCNPVYGDKIFGFVTVSEGVKIHRKNCPNARQMISKYGYRIIKVKWRKTVLQGGFETIIKVNGIDEMGMLGKISSAFSKDLRVNIHSITADTDEGFFNGTIKLEVMDITHLESLLEKLNNVKGILKAYRVDYN